MAAPLTPPSASDEGSRAPKRKCTEPDYGEAITVLVGDPARPFMIHRDYVCAKSKFFEAACSTRWLEGQEKTVKLDDVDPALFARYVHWAYYDSFEAKTSVNDRQDDHKKELLDAYLLGDRLDDQALRDHAMGLLHHHLRDTSTVYPLRSWIQRLYRETAAGSLLRKLMVKYTIARRSRGEFVLSRYPREFVDELASMALAKIPIRRADCGTIDEYLEGSAEI
ncbi:hypothetical protein B0A48_13222 [Cryoendolithus antarcticus]|uniref:BTB domain-containing protein n=1 Tax=Cryoendolithus antarcticus TaxID=1507870 RepID=A0A1V8SP29_9PEZI|nr:hypothetical protein B0A48_13222 [Cryoendolithus antarcticus]